MKVLIERLCRQGAVKSEGNQNIVGCCGLPPFWQSITLSLSHLL